MRALFLAIALCLVLPAWAVAQEGFAPQTLDLEPAAGAELRYELGGWRQAQRRALLAAAEDVATKTPGGAQLAADETGAGDETVPDDGFGDDGFGGDISAEPVHDPLEGWNRFWFGFNDVFYRDFWFPLATNYKGATPKEFRVMVSNFFDNAAAPVRVANNLLQLKFQAAGVEVSRFILNTWMGLGLFNPAKGKETVVEVDEEDFGQTLGVWSFGEGAYLVLPILGPSSVRDTVGMVGDSFAHPFYWTVEEWYYRAALRGYEQFNDTTFRLGEYESLTEAAVDPYVAMRNAYVNHRRAKVAK